MIEIFQGADEQWYFHVKGANGEIQALSEGYTRKQDAERGANDLVSTVLSMTRLKVKKGSVKFIDA